MGKTIDIIIAVDADKIMNNIKNLTQEKGGKVNGTTTVDGYYLKGNSVSDNYIAMIAKHDSVSGKPGSSELEVKVSTGDMIRWSMTTFGNNSDYTAYLYNASFHDQHNNKPMSDLVYFPQQTSALLPETDDPKGTVIEKPNSNFVMLSTVLASVGPIQYDMSFVLYNNTTQKPEGIFRWDPFIKISS